MAEIRFTVNNQTQTFEGDANMSLLWVLRDFLGLNGTKYGCGKGLCGACTVHLNGVAVRSCSIKIGALNGQSIVTIEGLAENGNLHPVQQAWVEEDVPQCGFCQAGQIMTATALLKKHPDPSDEEIDIAMNGNICRCGTYQRIRKSIHKASKMIK